jgi:uncharacterized protein YndB with AHSA1/START domain
VYGSPVAGPVHLPTSIDIRRPPEAVWPWLVDWEELPRWMREMRAVRVIGTRREGVGVEAVATVRIGFLSTTDPIVVTRWEPPAVLEIEHLGWVRGAGYMELSPTEEGTHLFWRESLVPPWGILGRLGMAAYRRILWRTFARDLERLRDLVDEGSG